MNTLIASLLLGYRTHLNRKSIAHLDDHLLADIGLTRDDLRHLRAKKTA